MIFEAFELGFGRNLYYLLASETTKEAVVIDTGFEAEEILKAAERLGVTIRHLINTHGHYDHVQENDVFVRKCGAAIYCHPKSLDAVAAASGIEADSIKTVDEGAVITIAPDLEFTVWHTPGHHAGGITLLSANKAFVGDTLFVDCDCGRADLRGGNITDLFASLQRLAMLPDETEIWCGHHYGAPLMRTMAEERELNRTLKCQTLDELKRIKKNWWSE